MRRFDQYYSEAQAYLDAFKMILNAQEEHLLTVFIQQGPEIVKAKLKINKDSDWQLVFDRLVFSGDVLKKCVMNFMPFFKAMVYEHGPQVLRTIFQIEAPKYDEVFGKLFDLVAVSEGALYDHVVRNSEAFVELIRSGKAGELRSKLCLDGDKYEKLWIDILELLFDSVNCQIQSEANIDRSLQLLAMLWDYPSVEGR